MSDQESFYDSWTSPDLEDMFPGNNINQIPMPSGGLSSIATLYQSSSVLLDETDQTQLSAAAMPSDYHMSGVPSVGESYRSSPSPGNQTAPDVYPSSPAPTPTSPMFVTTPNSFTTLNTVSTHFPFDFCTPQATVSTAGQLSPMPDSPLQLENNKLDLKELEDFVSAEIQKESSAYPTVGSVHVKPEPNDTEDDNSSLYDPTPKPPKRRGGRPRDPVVYEGVPPLTVMKKERRKEQNRRAARKCREKKKAHTEQIMADYSRMQSENEQLNETVSQLRRKLRLLQNTLKTHASQCNLLANQLTPRS